MSPFTHIPKANGPRSEYLVTDEYYHIYNRGVDKRSIVVDQADADRFIQGLQEFKLLQPIGSIYENSFFLKSQAKSPVEEGGDLVEIICYCLNPNHCHLILKQLVDGGISEYMKRIGGYTKYFNERYKRSGSLFQGTYKAKLIESNDYLLHVSAYVNCNDRVHKIKDPALRLVRSSFSQYLGLKSGFCKTDLILNQFKNAKEYRSFCEDSLELMLQSKEEARELKELSLE